LLILSAIQPATMPMMIALMMPTPLMSISMLCEGRVRPSYGMAATFECDDRGGRASAPRPRLGSVVAPRSRGGSMLPELRRRKSTRARCVAFRL
jgi:hypothetical protein